MAPGLNFLELVASGLYSRNNSSEFPLPALTDLPELVGFFSYSRDDDSDSEGGLTLLRRRIQSELRGQLGRSEKTLRLFQDAEAIPPGSLWEGEISGAIEQSAFFIPIISPRVVQSEHCGVEFRKFLDREKALGRTDLIFPILYIDVPELHEDHVWRNHPTLNVIGARQYVNWCDFRFELDGPQVRRAIAQFCTKIGATLRRNIKPVEQSLAPPRMAPLSVQAPAPATPAPIPKPASAPPKEAPLPDPVAVVDLIEQPIVRSKWRFSFSRVGLAGLCGIALMLQGLITLLGLWGSNPLGIEIVLVIMTGSSLVVGTRVQRDQSAQSLRLALYTSLIGLLLCFVLLAGVLLGHLVPAITELIAPSGIVLFAISAVFAGVERRKAVGVDRYSGASTASPTSTITPRKSDGHFGAPDFALSLALLLVVPALITIVVAYFVAARVVSVDHSMVTMENYISYLYNVFAYGVFDADFLKVFKALNFFILTQLLQILMGIILFTRGYSKNFRTTLFCMGAANVISSFLTFALLYRFQTPMIYIIPSTAAFVVALIACMWSVWVGGLKII